MPFEEQPQVVEQRRHVNVSVEITPPDTYTYSNLSSLAITPWDLRINFADFNPDVSSEASTIKASDGIVLPPEHAAGLLILLLQQLMFFEDQFGPIRHKQWRAVRDNLLKARTESVADATLQSGIQPQASQP